MNATTKLARNKARYLESLPKIDIQRCLVEKGDDGLRRFVIKGEQVMYGPTLPKVMIGGLSPLRMQAGPQGRNAAGVLSGHLKNESVLIDYGHITAFCNLEEVEFDEKFKKWYKDIAKPFRRRKAKKSWWRRLLG